MPRSSVAVILAQWRQRISKADHPGKSPIICYLSHVLALTEYRSIGIKHAPTKAHPAVMLLDVARQINAEAR